MRVQLNIGENNIVVPYHPEVHSDSLNHGYMDLRANPSLIPEIPEVQGWPELLALLHAINHPETQIRSLGCEKSFSEYANPEVPHLTTRLVSYVDIAFLSMPLNMTAIAFEEMVGAYAEFAQNATFEQFVMFDTELTNAHYKPENVRGFCISIWCGGFGANEDEARKAWGTVISALTSFFASGWTPNRSFQPTASGGG